MVVAGKWMALLCFAGAATWAGVVVAIAMVRSSALDKGRACGSPWSSPCFDRSRCVGRNGKQELSVYVYDEKCSSTPFVASPATIARDSYDDWRPVCIDALAAARRRAEEKGVLVGAPERACVVVYGLPPDDQCVTSTPTWHSGQNHLIIDFTDHPRYEGCIVDGVANARSLFSIV